MARTTTRQVWLAKPTAILLLSLCTYFTSSLLASCYCGDPISGNRNYTYVDNVQSNLGGVKVTLCWLVHCFNIISVAIGYTIASAISMMLIKRSNFFGQSEGNDSCHTSSNLYVIAFGLVQILCSQIPVFHQLWRLSILADVMYFTYSSGCLALDITQVIENGSRTGTRVGSVAEKQKIWRGFQALGDIAFAYSYSIVLIEMQDTVNSPLVSVGLTTIFYLCGCIGSAWTASAHIIMAVLGAGVLLLAWITAQLGWLAGLAVMLLFSLVFYHTFSLLASRYCSGDPISAKRNYCSGDPISAKSNYTYMDAVQSNLGGVKVTLCGIVQYLNLIGVGIGYTIAAAISMMAVKRSDCFAKSGGKNPCQINSTPYMIAFGFVQILFSQIPYSDEIWWLSVLAAVLSFTYSSAGFAFGIAQAVVNGKSKGGLTGISITEIRKIWKKSQNLGEIAFDFACFMTLRETQDTVLSEKKEKKQDTVKSPPSEEKTMKKATFWSAGVATMFDMLCGCMAYAALGDDLSPGNLSTDIVNAGIIVHLIGAYQVYYQPLFVFIENEASIRFPNSQFITQDINIPIPGCNPFRLNLFRLIWRTMFVSITTVISMLLPFFNDVVGLLGALWFWPLTVYFPVKIYIAQKKIPRWSIRIFGN